MFSYTAAFCTELECLEMRCVDILENGPEILSTNCHKLKHIVFFLTNSTGVDKLIKVNSNILSFNLGPASEHFPILGTTLEILGLHCPLLQKFVGHSMRETTSIQIETFTKGCPDLKELDISFKDIQSFKICHKLLHWIGNYNLALEKLSLRGINGSDNDFNDINSVLTREQCQSLQCLSNGCPLLKDIELANCKLSTTDVNYLVNHSIHLERLRFGSCNLCDDGLIITKKTDKLKYLKRLKFSFNR